MEAKMHFPIKESSSRAECKRKKEKSQRTAHQHLQQAVLCCNMCQDIRNKGDLFIWTQTGNCQSKPVLDSQKEIDKERKTVVKEVWDKNALITIIIVTIISYY